MLSRLRCSNVKRMLVYIPNRTFLGALKDKVTASVDNSQDKKQKAFFDKQMSIMLGSSDYTLRMWLDSQKEIAELSGGTGWRSYVAKAMPNETHQTILDDMKKEIDILEAFPDGVKDNLEPITGVIKGNVAEKTTTGKEQINFLIKKFEAQKAFAKFLRDRKKSGLSMPEGFQEAQELMQKEGGAETMKGLKPKVRRRRSR